MHETNRGPGAGGSGVLLTGATGFVGSFLLRALLLKTDAQVHCPVRGATESAALDRLRGSLAGYGLEDLDRTRIVPVPGDLTAPDLGLGRDGFQSLAERVGTVVHAGAEVNLVKPARMLEAANVAGTAAVLRLAAARGAAVHFLSTSEVFGPAPGSVTEDTAPEGRFAAASGYGQTKRTAELMVLAAELPTAVHRLDRIVGDRATGACQPRGDDFWLLARTAVAMGALPDTSVNITPVDFAADALVALAAAGPDSGAPVTHICHPRPTPMTDLAIALADFGLRVDVLPLPAWTTRLEKWADRPDADPASRLLSVIAGRVLGGSPRFLAPRTNEALAARGLHHPPVDVPTLVRYVRHLARAGFWAAAEHAGRPVPTA
ncbi:thioester reductase domain-containing protein [Streptomyces sp. NPDC059524]|uniref:thioester reductase domain-containing protein n=1 Tax=Streptomyces sp. NPDC059524 TaxID=3346856 RepID=UPI00367C6ED5